MTHKPINSRVQHGDPTCADYGCKQPECLEARRIKQKRNKFLRQTGRPGAVSSERAAHHLRRLRSAGLMDKEILHSIPLARNTFYRILRGEPLTRDVEQRILSFPAPAEPSDIRTLASTNTTGAHRRLQALVWMGWPQGVLEERLGVHAGWIGRSLNRSSLTLVMHARIVRLYDQLWRLAPERAGVDGGRAAVARLYASSMDWNGPLAWDDDTIDDPKAVPQTDADEPIVSEGGHLVDRWLMGESVVLGRVERGDVLVHLFEWSELAPDEIAVRLDMTASAASRAWERHKEKAREAGGPVPWRRRYALRNKELTANEMGAAA